MLNRQNFYFHSEAQHTVKLLVPEYATRAEIHLDDEGYWINVWWQCEIIAPLTIQEYEKAFSKAFDPADYDIRDYRKS